MAEFVWFFLAEVRALASEEQALVEGSQGELQCFLPASKIEVALLRLDDFLKGQAFARTGVRIAQRFDPDSSSDEVGNDLLERGIAEVAATGTPFRGVLFVDKQTAQWKSSAEDRRGQ